jgi:prepilin signal peptidase PulO-like enzyme (type II secretory pathway)
VLLAAGVGIDDPVPFGPFMLLGALLALAVAR